MRESEYTDLEAELKCLFGSLGAKVVQVSPDHFIVTIAGDSFELSTLSKQPWRSLDLIEQRSFLFVRFKTEARGEGFESLAGYIALNYPRLGDLKHGSSDLSELLQQLPAPPHG